MDLAAAEKLGMFDSIPGIGMPFNVFKSCNLCLRRLFFWSYRDGVVTRLITLQALKILDSTPGVIIYPYTRQVI